MRDMKPSGCANITCRRDEPACWNLCVFRGDFNVYGGKVNVQCDRLRVGRRDNMSARCLRAAER